MHSMSCDERNYKLPSERLGPYRLWSMCRYRAPECLLTDGYYSYKMDMWGVGCVFFEVVALFPLFPGTNEADQIQKIHAVLGSPAPEVLAKFRRRAEQHGEPPRFTARSGTGIASLIPHCGAACVDLIEKLLVFDPDVRISARQALKHHYFKDVRCESCVKLHGCTILYLKKDSHWITQS